VLHAFSGSAQQGEQFYQLGFCLGIGGSISYERAQKTRKAVSHLPVESLLLETDGPTMPLSGYQGERNDPCRISDVFSLLATLRDESTDALACQLELNVERLFHLSPSAV
jgi:TatD DNase family protein